MKSCEVVTLRSNKTRNTDYLRSDKDARSLNTLQDHASIPSAQLRATVSADRSDRSLTFCEQHSQPSKAPSLVEWQQVIMSKTTQSRFCESGMNTLKHDFFVYEHIKSSTEPNRICMESRWTWESVIEPEADETKPRILWRLSKISQSVRVDCDSCERWNGPCPAGDVWNKFTQSQCHESTSRNI